MTPEELHFKLDVMNYFEFQLNGSTYMITFDKNAESKKKYHVQRRDSCEEFWYADFNALMAHCHIENHYLKGIISTLS